MVKLCLCNGIWAFGEHAQLVGELPDCVEYGDIWGGGQILVVTGGKVGIVQSVLGRSSMSGLGAKGTVSLSLVSGYFVGCGLWRGPFFLVLLQDLSFHTPGPFLFLPFCLLLPTPQAMGSPANLSAEVEQATRRQVQVMQSSQQKNRERVLAQLLGMVCDVRPQVHPNYRIAA